MKVVRATGVDDALRALAEATPTTRILAGGTDLMVEFEGGRTLPDLVIDVWRVRELARIEDERGGVRVGALATCTDLLRSPLARERADILVLAAREVGAEQIRNRATLGGNLGTASPAADLNPVLFALSARVRLRSRNGTRELAVEDFVTGYRSNGRKLDELIESVWIPPRAPNEQRAFRKVGTRRAQSIAKVVVAMAIELDHDRVRKITAAAGSVAERTLRLSAFEQALTGRTLDPVSIEQCARVAAEGAARPQTDVRSTEAYRREVLRRILLRMLMDATSSSRLGRGG